MEQIKLKDYVAPLLEVVEVKVENGFRNSDNENGNDGGITLPDWEII